MSSEKQMRLTHRIERLEREARRWRCAAAVLGGVLGIVGLVGATKAEPVPVAEEIRARRFVLVDELGRARGVWDVRDDGPELVLLGKNGQAQVKLYGLTNMSGLYLTTEARESSAQLYATADTWAYLHLSGKDREGAWVTRVDGAHGLSQQRLR